MLYNFHAGLQGMDKGYRELVTPFFKYRSGVPLNAAERRGLGRAVKGWTKMTAIGLFGLSLDAIYRDDPEYEEIGSYLRATHWMIKESAGRWWAIPKPFQFAVLSNIFERAFEFAYKDDPLAWERMREGLAEIMVPPLRAPGISVPTELVTNYNLFTERPIVPQHLKGLEPVLQWNAYASEFGLRIGKMLGVSPLKVDHAITGFGASWGRQILNWSNLARDNAADTAPEDTFILRRFLKSSSRGSTSTRKFWDLISQDGGEMELVAQSYKRMKENGTLGNASEYLAGKPESAVAYAILNEAYDAKYKRLHPLRRAQDAITTISKFRQEMALDQVKTIILEEPIPLPGSLKGAVNNVLSRLSMIEARNSLIAVGIRGWKQKAYMDTEPLWAQLEAASPQVYEEMIARFNKAKVYPESGVRAVWAEAQRRILVDREDALLGDLFAEAVTADQPWATTELPQAGQPK